MDFILSKLMNRSSPTPQNSEINSNNTQFENKDNHKINDTIHKLDENNINKNNQCHQQQKQCTPICADKNIKSYERNDSLNKTNETSKSCKESNAEHKAQKVLNQKSKVNPFTIHNLVIEGGVQTSSTSNVDEEFFEKNVTEIKEIDSKFENSDLNLSLTDFDSNILMNKTIILDKSSFENSNIHLNEPIVNNDLMNETKILDNNDSKVNSINTEEKFLELLGQVATTSVSVDCANEINNVTVSKENLTAMPYSDNMKVEEKLISEILNGNKIEFNESNITAQNVNEDQIKLNLNTNIVGVSSKEILTPNLQNIIKAQNNNDSKTIQISKEISNEISQLSDEKSTDSEKTNNEIENKNESDLTSDINNDLNVIPIIENNLNQSNEKIDEEVKSNSNDKIVNTAAPESNVSLKDILLNENINKESAALPELSQLFAPQITPILNTIDDLKEENVKQPSGIASTTTANHGNGKSVIVDSTIVKKPQSKLESTLSKKLEENINPYELRKPEDVSSLFSTPDSISPNETFTEKSLPDIINTLPTISVNGAANNELNISSLANHLNALQVNVSDTNNLNATITKSNVSPSNISIYSSDDELFAECESFPVTANSSTTDFSTNNIHGFRTQTPSNLNITEDLNEKQKDDLNDLSKQDFQQEELEKEIEIKVDLAETKLNENLNETVTNSNQCINPPHITITPVTPDNSGINLSSTDEKLLISECKTKQNSESFSKAEHEEFEGDRCETEPHLVNIIHRENANNEENVNAHSKENDLEDITNQLNNSSQWCDVVSTVNSNEQENLERSHIELLNTTPPGIIDPNSLQEINSDEVSDTQENLTFSENAKQSNTCSSTVGMDISDIDIAENVSLNESEIVKKENDISKIPEIKSQSQTPKVEVEVDVSLKSNSLNDENINIQNDAQKKTSTYSNNVTMECIDRSLNETLDISEKTGITPLNQTQNMSTLNETQNSSSLNKTIDMSPLNETTDISPINETIDILPLNEIRDKKIDMRNLNETCDLTPQTNVLSGVETQNIEFPFIKDETFGIQINHNENHEIINSKIKQPKIDECEIQNPKVINLTNVNSRGDTRNITSSCYDFEPMDVDLEDDLYQVNENQKNFEEFNKAFNKPKIPNFNEPPSNFGVLSNNDQFKSIGNENNIDLVFQSCDFDYLSKRGTVKDIPKDSLLLKFDPLLGKPVPVTGNLQNLKPIIQEEDEIIPENSKGIETKEEFNFDNNVLINVPTTESKPVIIPVKSINNNKKIIEKSISTDSTSLKLEEFEKLEILLQLEEKSFNEKMSVDVIQNNIKIDNDIQSNENINSINSNEKQDLKMEDLEKKIKNEVLKTEDVEKKLKDAEQREEALLKRITEKDKTIAKMGGVIEAYEKAIAELIAEKEQITQNYEKQMEEIKSERDLNKQHLESLESTFTDLHAKYERSKQLLAKLKASEEELQAEKKRNLENLGLQEQRYEKMKNHAMQQLEIANNKLEHLTKNHHLEITKLKALLKKEEIAKSSINEQLIQKSKENEELVKICDELINGGSTS